MVDAHLTPSFDGATEWLNSDPIELAELRGRVVVVDFWTLTCINWLRTAPFVRAWADRYRGDGLVVIGVHTPEFSFETDVGGVRDAIDERGIRYPVAIDNDYRVWSAFRNNYWPALYTFDAQGVVRDYHPGEGGYGQSERVIQQLLGVDRALAPVVGTGVEAAADWDHLQSPETYLGHGRGGDVASPGGGTSDRRREYELPRQLGSNRWGLAGGWTIEPECIVLEEAGGSVAYRFHARDVHLVLSRRSSAPIAFRVAIDGDAPGASHGADVDTDGHGLLAAGRLYQLVRQHGAVKEHTVEITFHQQGAEAYVFTFG